MKTTYEVTLKITVTHDKANPLVDSNSVKGAITRGIEGITNADFSVYGDSETTPTYVAVTITKLKENGKRQALSLFGDGSFPWYEA